MTIKHLLLVDDSELDNMVNCRMVERNNYAANIVVKTTAMAALNYLSDTFQNNRERLPEMIFLDIRMPEMDGFGFLEKFHQMDDIIKEKCRVVMVSSSIDPDDYQKAADNPYVVKFVNKPLTNDTFEELKKLEIEHNA